MAEAVTEIDGKAAYVIARTDAGEVAETRLTPRLLT
jgi:hypothetical protein